MEKSTSTPRCSQLCDHAFRVCSGRYGILVPAAILVWVSRYWLFRSYGLYEDDFTRIPQAMTRTAGAMFDYTWDQLWLFGQGRPLHSIFISWFAWIGALAGGLEAMYILGFLISVLNTVLLYLCLHRLAAPRIVSAVTTIAFATYPGDVSQTFLTHSFGVLPSLTLVLLACLAWMSGRWISTALLAATALMCYETPVAAMLGACLAHPRSQWRRACGLAVLLLVLITAFAALRLWIGEERVASLHIGELLTIIPKQVVVGSWTSFRSYVYRPLTEYPFMDTSAIHLGLFGVLLGGIAACGPRGNIERRTMARLAVAAIVWTASSYLLTLTVEANYDWGRPSRVHFPASVGCAVLVGCLAGLVSQFAGRRTAIAFAALLTGASVAGLTPVQQDYAKAHRLQRQFWTDVLSLTPDLAQGKAVFLDRYPELPDARHMRMFEFHLPLIIPMLAEFSNAEPPPRIYYLQPDWKKHVDAAGGIALGPETIFLYLPWASHPVKVAAKDAIFLEPHQGRLRRVGSAGTPALAAPERGILYPVLVNP
jgi:hypothetical protein